MGLVLRSILPAAAAALALAVPVAASPTAHTAAERKAAHALGEAADLRDGAGVRTGRELSPALLELARGMRHLRGGARERAVSLLSRPTDADALDDERYRVPALPPLCDANFCVHSVATGADAPGPGMPALVLAQANAVRAFENGTLGWREPPSDGDGRVDIYLKELGEEKLFGFAATDPGQDSRGQHAYLVIDDDFDPDQYGGLPALDSLQITLAHEYGHVLQYGYDVSADSWHYEASATWLEHRMHPEHGDWIRFLTDRPSGPGWASLTEVPLTAFADEADSERNAKPYGDVVLNHFLTNRYGAAGDRLQRATWELSNGFRAPSTHAYDEAIRGAGGSGLASDFAAFAAAVAEWGMPASGFPRASDLPDVERVGVLTQDGAGAARTLDHLTFAFFDVRNATAPRIRLAASFPAGTRGAIALVARAGESGPVTTKLLELPAGGAGGVTLDSAASLLANGGRVTAVLVNADARENGLGGGDWNWTRDNQAVAARITSDLTGPLLSARTPAPGATGVATGAFVTATFSKDVNGVSDQTFTLRDARGRSVPATVSYARATRTATLVPVAGLSDTTRYTARLSDSIVDASATTLPQTEWSFTTVRRRPIAALGKIGTTRRAATVALASGDPDRLTWIATLRRGGRAIASRTGALRAGATRTIRLRGRAGRARLVVRLTDPQGNRTRLVRRVTLLP